MHLDVPRTEVAGLIQHFAPASKRGGPSFPIATMVRIHFIPHWLDLSDPAMEEASHDMALFQSDQLPFRLKQDSISGLFKNCDGPTERLVR
jgi:hypothetical protein